MKKVDRIREALTPRLAPGEELVSVGQVASGPITTTTAVVFGMMLTLLNKYWYVGVTQERMLFVRLTAMSKPDETGRFATPLSNVKLEEKGIGLVAPEDGMPQKFRFYFGAQRATGLDLDEFKGALAKQGS